MAVSVVYLVQVVLGTEKRGGGVGAGVRMRERVLMSVWTVFERSIFGVGRWVARCMVVLNGFLWDEKAEVLC